MRGGRDESQQSSQHTKGIRRCFRLLTYPSDTRGMRQEEVSLAGGACASSRTLHCLPLCGLETSPQFLRRRPLEPGTFCCIFLPLMLESSNKKANKVRK